MTNKIILTIAGQGQPQIITYDRPVICTIGRDTNCEIYLTNSGISGKHCQLEINPPQIKIKDLQSTFGTEIHRSSLAKISLTPHNDYILNAGDQIILSQGTITITVDIEINGKSLTYQVIPFPVSPGQNNTPIKKLSFWENIKNFLGLNNDNLSSTNIPGYRIIEKIAETKLSEIYLATHIQTQTEVVLKVMSSEIQSDVKSRDIFFREFENTRALDHPNIVKFKHQGWADNLFFFTLEYCDQGSVYDIIQKRKRPFSPQESIDITLQILEGLIYAHEQAEVPYVMLANGTYGKGKGVIHRDIKPANILLKTEGGKTIAKLADFGLSKSMNLAGLTNLTAAGFLQGSLQFMSRKQVLNYRYSDPSMDVWSTIATLYYMLTGHYPRDFTTAGDDLLIVLQTPAISIHRRNPNIPHPLANLINEGLRENPNPFFQNAGAFKTALTTVKNQISP